ncbi:MAG: phosphomannomutase/phosphoglucomutase [bacterium]
MDILIDNGVFGKNDIRGIVGEKINPELFELIGKAYTEFIKKRKNLSINELWVSVAYDARKHSPELANALIKGLLSGGINVIDLGLCPTPLAYFSEYQNLDLAGTLIVTASHNPPAYNGLKMTYNKNTLLEEEILELKEITKNLIEKNFLDNSAVGIYKKYNIIPDYINNFTEFFSKINKKIKIVVDSGNATAGIVAPELYKKIDCEVIDIYSEPDGDFPNHHPDPSNEKNLEFLKKKVLETNADFGIAFDGDSDRVGIVDNTGYSIPGDQLLLIFALDVLKQSKQEEKLVFISEVKCSQVLFDSIEQNNGKAIMWKTGHAYIKSKMKEEKAVLAGEMSGHLFFKDRYYGFDDAIYAGCRFIEIIAKNKENNPDFKVSDLIESLPKAYTSRELRIPCPDNLKFKVIDNLKFKLNELNKNSDLFKTKIEKIITIDGLRIVFNDGFALIRASNTEPTFTLRFEGKTLDNMDNYKNILLNILDESLKELHELSE